VDMEVGDVELFIPLLYGIVPINITIYYILSINIRDTNKRTILGKIYLDSIYNISTTNEKAKTISLI